MVRRRRTPSCSPAWRPAASRSSHPTRSRLCARACRWGPLCNLYAIHMYVLPFSNFLTSTFHYSSIYSVPPPWLCPAAPNVFAGCVPQSRLSCISSPTTASPLRLCCPLLAQLPACLDGYWHALGCLAAGVHGDNGGVCDGGAGAGLLRAAHEVHRHVGRAAADRAQGGRARPVQGTPHPRMCPMTLPPMFTLVHTCLVTPQAWRAVLLALGQYRL